VERCISETLRVVPENLRESEPLREAETLRVAETLGVTEISREPLSEDVDVLLSGFSGGFSGGSSGSVEGGGWSGGFASNSATIFFLPFGLSG
jgi:hypothetical protein